MKFSVIIPTFNRPLDLAACLGALAQLDYPSEFEVIVVDDGGECSLESVCDAHRSALQLRLLRQPNQGPATARNHGASQAAGVFLAFIDDDCVPQAGWLKALDAAADRYPDALLGGHVTNGFPANPYSQASQDIIDFLHNRFNGDQQHGRFFPSNNIALAAELFREIGGFDLAFHRSASEDRDLCDRWLQSGRSLVSVPDAVVKHNRAMTLRSFWKQHFLYGRGAFQYAQARKRRGSGPVPFEGWRFHAGMILWPRTQGGGPNAFYRSVLVLLSQVAVTIAYFCESRAQKQQAVSTRYNLARK
ncbi:MAG TPA: glycosyltransferase [Bryobacteraceae bacterium]|nr:glycosyltransferase [Bryobacteraceae bacterium]